jgi:opacity protein-like surface antigen
MENIKMKKVLFATTAIVGILGASISGAQAESSIKDGMYARGSLGISILEDSNNKGSVLDIENETENGFVLSGALGYEVKKNIRLELEVNYRDNGEDSLTIANAGSFTGLSTNADGDVRNLSAMVNGYYDFKNVTSNEKLTPYLTGGIGLARVDADVTSNGTQIVDDNDTVFAYQLGIGVGYDINDKTTLDFGYRYFGTQDPDLTDASGADFESEYSNHAILAGVRYDF